VTPFHYYRLDATTRTASVALWAAVFFDAAGNELVADVYDSIEASPGWQATACCIRAHALAAQVRFRFRPQDQPLFIRTATVTEVSADAAATWIDAVAASLPPLHYTPPAERGLRLPKTTRTLREGGRLRLVMLGDSICNDTSNSLFELLLRRACPKAQVEVVTSVHGGAGCRFYRESSRVRDYVLRFAPDLVIVAGISHGYDVAAFGDVLRQIRTASPCDLLVLTGAIAPERTCREGHLKASAQPGGLGPETVDDFPARLRQLAEAEGAEFLDFREAWDQYLSQSPRPGEWFRRDAIHGNTRGKQVAGRILARFLSPCRS
jgi:hypothetical protein